MPTSMEVTVLTNRLKLAGQRSLNSGELRARLNTPIDVSLVSELLKMHCGGLKLPAESDREWLAVRLLAARNKIDANRRFYKASNDRLLLALNSMSSLRDVLQEIATKDCYEDAPDTVKDAWEQDLSTSRKASLLGPPYSKVRGAQQMIGNLLQAIMDLEKSPLFVLQDDNVKDPSLRKPWHAVLHDIVYAYQEAMHSTNSKDRLAIHQEGPGGRFVTDAITYVTGEDIKLDTVQRKWSAMLAANKTTDFPYE